MAISQRVQPAVPRLLTAGAVRTETFGGRGHEHQLSYIWTDPGEIGPAITAAELVVPIDGARPRHWFGP